MLTFLAGSELNPDSLRSKIKEITIVGLVGFFAPFIGATIIAYFILHWGLQSSLLTGIALSTTSMAVVYAVIPAYIIGMILAKTIEKDNFCLTICPKNQFLIF